VRTKFYDILLARKKSRCRNRTSSCCNRSQERHRPFEAGTTSSFEKTPGRGRLANGQVPLITARNDYRIAIEEIRQLLGYTKHRAENLRKVRSSSACWLRARQLRFAGGPHGRT